MIVHALSSVPALQHTGYVLIRKEVAIWFRAVKGVMEYKYGVPGTLSLFTGHVTQPNFGPKIGSKMPEQ